MGKIVAILFGVLALGLVIYVVHANFLGSTFSQLGSLFHYNPSGLFAAPSSPSPRRSELPLPRGDPQVLRLRRTAV